VNNGGDGGDDDGDGDGAGNSNGTGADDDSGNGTNANGDDETVSDDAVVGEVDAEDTTSEAENTPEAVSATGRESGLSGQLPVLPEDTDIDGPNPPLSDVDINGNPVPRGTQTAQSASKSASATSMAFSLLALANTALLLAGAVIGRRRRYADELERVGSKALKALAVIAGVATPIVWLIVDWPFTSITFINQWSPYTAAAFAVNVGLTLAYHLSKAGAVKAAGITQNNPEG
jgi:hypothetical protein